ncbi:SAM-dependent methyltransferase [Crossiella equi]|uniref:SAM-dependent methyltransferase n=1 Tax=Crossiella equi TaxID=130796 RepID=A0ABS5A839_9PSEU|nr:hypothetical protein [Crossiella equi]MBP2472755.1 SAM-dependent methyltransferase [Crossiella equi]
MTGLLPAPVAPVEVVPVQRAPEDVLADVAAAVLGPGEHLSVDLLDILDGVVRGPVDAVRANDDLLPRLAHENNLDTVLDQIRRLLRPGGVLVAAVPELARLGNLRPTAPPPRVTGAGRDRQVTVQLWDWAEDGSSYGLDVVQLVRGSEGWLVSGSVSTHHRVLSADEVAQALDNAGFAAVQRLSPTESGHPMPVWVALAPR